VILAAALLVLVGLGLFVGGILTGATVLYWLCVAACVAAGIFLVLARTRMGRAPAASAAPAAAPTEAAGPAQAPATPEAEPSPPAAAAWERTAGRGWEPAGAPVGDPAVPPVAEPLPPERSSLPPSEEPSTVEPPSTAAHAPRRTSGAEEPSGEPPVEDVEVTDLLLVVDLRDEVLVVDEHPRYHVDGCRWLAGRETIPLPVDEARTDGFTPCGWCEPDRTLAERERGRRAGRRTS
jgi:hypothetical protein